MQRQSQANTSPHIVELKPNLQGDDYVIGDVHGNRECLEVVLEQLGEHDRLFIAGDLVDRGLDNAGVIDLIMQRPGQIFCVRGNHEDMCLAALKQLEKCADDFEDLPDEMVDLIIKKIERRESESLSKDQNRNHVWLHVINGGGWLIDLLKNELSSGLITRKEEGIEYHAGTRLGKIKKFLSELPYIIYVSDDFEHGRLPFKLVHAAMPFDENELLRRIENKLLSLSADEIKYLIWARDKNYFPDVEVPIVDINELPDASLTYVGHSIVSESGMAVREKTNTIVTDIGSYAYDAALLVNHTKRVAAVVGDKQSKAQLFDEIEQIVNQHLGIQVADMRNDAGAHQGREKKTSISPDDVKLFCKTHKKRGKSRNDSALPEQSHHQRSHSK